MASIPLADYLRSLTKRAWAPGSLDCGVFMADWVTLVCGKDPISDVRGSYSTEAGFAKILLREGGFAKSCAARIEEAGFIETSRPSSGDIAVVLAPYSIGKTRPTGSICVSETMRAVVTSDLGLVIAGLPILRAFTFHA